MGNKRTGKQTVPKNKFRFDPKEKQPEPVASFSGGTPNDSSSLEEDIIKDTFQTKKDTPSPTFWTRTNTFPLKTTTTWILKISTSLLFLAQHLSHVPPSSKNLLANFLLRPLLDLSIIFLLKTTRLKGLMLDASILSDL